MLKLLRFLPRAIKERVIRSRLRLVDAELEGVTVKIATTVDEHEQASRLVHDAYVRRGLITPHASGVRITAHGLLPSTIVFVAMKDGAVVGTMSLVLDSVLGVPMQKAFGAEVEALRADLRNVAEVGALCVAPRHRGTGIAYLLNKLMWQTSARLGVNSLVIAVSPYAACVYEAMLRFVPMGGVRHYPGLTATTFVQALHLDLDTAEDVFLRDFSHLGADPRSPYWLYVLREDPQIERPSDALLDRQLVELRSVVAQRLDALRPDCLAALDNPERRLLRPVMPKLRDQLRSRPLLRAL